MKRYTVVFMFRPDTEWVWLIEKQKPDWQKGLLNGIGGKIEQGESPVDCAVRELKEESGIELLPTELTEVGKMQGKNNDGSEFEVYVFTGITHKTLSTQEEEEIKCYPVDSIQLYKRVENIQLLVETCVYRLNGKSNFNKMIMIYDK